MSVTRKTIRISEKSRFPLLHENVPNLPKSASDFGFLQHHKSNPEADPSDADRSEVILDVF